MEKKLNVFKNIDTSELKSIGATEKTDSKPITHINVDDEFNQTNLHTKHTHETTDNKDNNENNENKEDTENISLPKQGKNRLGKILPGKIALSMADKIIPSLLVLALYYMNLQIDKRRLQLTKDEINELAPAVQDCLDSIEIDFDNPWITLGVMLGVVYGSKVIDAIPDISKLVKKKDNSNKSIDARLDDIIDIDEEKTNNQEEFEVAYQALAEEIKAKRNRGIKDAKSYLAEMFPEKIKKLGAKYKVDVTEHLNYRHVQPSQVSQKKKKDDNQFNLPE